MRHTDGSEAQTATRARGKREREKESERQGQEETTTGESPTSKDLHKAREQGSLLELPRVKVRRTAQGNIEFLRF